MDDESLATVTNARHQYFPCLIGAFKKCRLSFFEVSRMIPENGR
jgi:hypothetical protein